MASNTAAAVSGGVVPGVLGAAISRRVETARRFGLDQVIEARI